MVGTYSERLLAIDYHLFCHVNQVSVFCVRYATDEVDGFPFDCQVVRRHDLQLDLR